MSAALLGKSRKGRESLVLEGYGRDIWIREGNWACIPSGKNPKGVVKEAELYDLRNDVAQKHNLASKYPGRVKEMTARLEAVRNNR